MTRLSLQIPTLVALTINVQNNFYVTMRKDFGAVFRQFFEQ